MQIKVDKEFLIRIDGKDFKCFKIGKKFFAEIPRPEKSKLVTSEEQKKNLKAFGEKFNLTNEFLGVPDDEFLESK